MNARIAACLFDLDGVIIDTAKYHFQAWRELAAELGFVFTARDNERLKGVSRLRSLDILLEVGGLSFDAAAKQRMAAQKNARYRELVLQMRPDEILPGAVAFLDACRGAGVRTALASASRNARDILAHVNLADRFDAVADGTCVTETKPAPDVFLYAAAALGVPASGCVVFEDAAAGLVAGHAAGMFCVGIGTPEVLADADLVASGLDALNLAAVQTAFAAART